MQPDDDPMLEIYDIATALTHVEGSYRDVNFERPTQAGVNAMLESLGSAFTSCTVTHGDGTKVTGPPSQTLQALTGSEGWASLEGGAELVSHLQIFIGRYPDGTLCVELTFFPQDVIQSDDLRRDFIAWVRRIARQLEARRAYARYMKESWQIGDLKPESGVIAVFDMEQADASPAAPADGPAGRG